MTQAIHDPAVRQVFEAHPEAIREKLLWARRLILDVASRTSGVGEITEALKWGQISYLTHDPRSGTTIRIDRYGQESQRMAFFVHCQTTLVESFREMYPDALTYEGTRAVIWDDPDERQIELLRAFAENALTYHQRKNG